MGGIKIVNAKRIWFHVPTLFVPYIAVLACIVIFYTDSTLFTYIMENIFDSNALYVLGIVVIFMLFAAVLSTLCFIIGICRKWDAGSLAKTAMIIKLLQIPAYILIFMFGIIMVIVPMGFLFIWIVCVFDYIVLLLTGLISLSAILNAIRQKKIEAKKSIWLIILQFVFVADVVATILLFLKLREKKKEKFE